MNIINNDHTFSVDWACADAEYATPILYEGLRGGEVRYIIHRQGWWPILVVATFHQDGTVTFDEQESGESGWFKHSPAPGEESFALDLLRSYPSLPGGELHPRFQLRPLPKFGG